MDYPIDRNDPCKCKNVEASDQLVVNYDLLMGDAHVIHNKEKGGCGKFIRDWSRD